MALSSKSNFSYSSSRISIFNEKYFEYWSSQIEIIFISQDLWDTMEEGFEEPLEEEYEAWTEKKQKIIKRM